MSQPEPDDSEDEGPFTLDDIEADRQDERRWMAYHEAGHIAVIWALGAYPVSVDIIAKPSRLGLAVFRLGNDGRSASVGKIIICFGGPIAAKRHAPKRIDGGCGDREDIKRHLAALCRTEEAAAIVRDHCEREAARLVDENWDAVEVIADALVKREALTDLEIAEVLAPISAAREAAENMRKRRAWKDLVARTSHPSITPIRDTPDAL